jgi:plasmid stabilization system protein ParE
MYKHLIQPKAQKEYEKSVKWYAERSEQATINFINTIELQIGQICRQPHKYRNKYKNFYEAKLKIYPFTIIFLIEEEARQIIIMSIYHHKRNPAKKYR